MGTEVLIPQDWLAERFHVSPAPFHHRRKYFPANGNGQNNHLNTTNYGYRNPGVVRTVQKKKPHHQEMTNPKRFPSIDDFKVVSKHTQISNNQNNEFSAAKVTILRRGQSLDFLNDKIKKDRSNRNMNNNLTTQIRFGLQDTMYAGSAFSTSPSPSDLPLPTFFKKHQSFDESFDDSATRDLRRLLRIQ